jgi:hypothetical protein
MFFNVEPLPKIIPVGTPNTFITSHTAAKIIFQTLQNYLLRTILFINGRALKHQVSFEEYY